MWQTILRLCAISLIPIGVSIVFALLEKYNKHFQKMHRVPKQILVGVTFGVVAILGTVLGVPIEDGSIINVRDAGPIIAGLMFGGPAGIIAGFLGGLYRFVSVYWGGSGAYTQLACSISTLLAGIFTAIVRRFIFDKHHGNWYYGFFIGVLIEDFHMMMVFLTHMNDVKTAYETVSACALPMILVNSLAVMIALTIASIIFREKLFKREKKLKVGTRIQLVLIASLLVGYTVVATFSYGTIRNVVLTGVKNNSIELIDDVINEVDDSVDEYFYDKVDEIRELFNNSLEQGYDLDATIRTAISTYQIDEINLVSKENIILYSNFEKYIHFDMTQGDQSNEFTILNEYPELDVYIQELREPTSKEFELTKYAGAVITDNRGLDSEDTIGYVQIGLYENKYYSLLGTKVISCADNRHINKNGFIAVASSSGYIVSTVDDATLGIGDFIEIEKLKQNDQVEYVVLTGNTQTKYYAYTRYVEGFYIVGFSEKAESDLPITIGFLGVTLAEIFIFLVLYAVIYMSIKIRVVDKIKNISNDLTDISNGDLNVQVDVRSSYEFDSLSNDINKTVDTLKGYIKMEATKNEEELEFARNIQHSVLPTSFPFNDKFEIFAMMDTAKQVGGDFYDFYYIDREHMVIQIADVSGKGIPAAMFMMEAKTIIKSLLETGMDIGEAYTEANKRLCDGNDAQMFVTAWGAVVDLSTGVVNYVNAGHNPPLIKRGNNKFEYLHSKAGFVLGGFMSFHYEKQSFNIEPGDMIYLYTDGVTEANNVNKDLYSESKLEMIINHDNYSNAREVCEAVRKDVSKFVGDAEQSDDITMLCFKLNGNESTHILVCDAVVDNIPNVTNFVDDLLDKYDAQEKAKIQINIAIDEIFSNISRYAYKKGAVGKAKITVDFNETKDEVKIVFEDRGIPYNPLERKDPNAKAGLDEREIGGLGIFIVKKSMDSMEYENVNGHNILTLKKKFKQ